MGAPFPLLHSPRATASVQHRHHSWLLTTDAAPQPLALCPGTPTIVTPVHALASLALDAPVEEAKLEEDNGAARMWWRRRRSSKRTRVLLGYPRVQRQATRRSGVTVARGRGGERWGTMSQIARSSSIFGSLGAHIANWRMPLEQPLETIFRRTVQIFDPFGDWVAHWR
jgi:hypothetical protein